MKVSCAILAGGKSRRMGRDKATIHAGSRLLISHVYGVVADVFPDIIVVSNHHNSVDGVNARIVRDIVPIQGPMTGIVSALLNSVTPYVFILGCDMPFLTKEAIHYMIDSVHGEDIVIPKTQAGLEPLHAIYNRSCISPMLTAVERGLMKIPLVFPFFSVKTVEEDKVFCNRGVSVFTNVNTEEDLARAERLLR